MFHQVNCLSLRRTDIEIRDADNVSIILGLSVACFVNSLTRVENNEIDCGFHHRVQH